MKNHEMKILSNAADGGVGVACECGWISSVTDEVFAKAVHERHLRHLKIVET